MRGKPLPWWSLPQPFRNIPAYAGKTGAVAQGVQVSAEHPRVCGENLSSLKDKVTSTGTSPRMRGKLADSSKDTLESRNIPAYAGKTPSCRSSQKRSWEHPRVCGENPTRVDAVKVCNGTSPRMRGNGRHGALDDFTDGTSPRMRGKLLGVGDTIGFARNIPAYAGKTPSLDTERSSW